MHMWTLNLEITMKRFEVHHLTYILTCICFHCSLHTINAYNNNMISWAIRYRRTLMNRKCIINETKYLLLQKQLELYWLNKHIFAVISAISTATKIDILCQKLHFIFHIYLYKIVMALAISKRGYWQNMRHTKPKLRLTQVLRSIYRSPSHTSM